VEALSLLSLSKDGFGEATRTMATNQIDPEIYDDEAFVGIEDGQILDGKVVDDLNDDGVEQI
jgi:hypothetical protein